MTKLNSLEGKIKEYLKLKYPQSLTNKEHIKTAHDIAEIAEKEYKFIWKGGELFDRRLMINQKIEQLEKENTDLKDEIKQWQVSWDIIVKENPELKILLADKDKEIDKLMNDTSECDTCLDLCFANEKLTKQLAEYELINNHHVGLIGRQEEELKAVKYLDRGEVDDFVKEVITIAVENFGDEDGEPIDDLPIQIFEKNEKDFERIITAICNLAIKPITKDKIIKALVKHSAIEEIELKNGGTVAYRVIGQAGFEQIANEILNNKDNI